MKLQALDDRDAYESGLVNKGPTYYSKAIEHSGEGVTIEVSGYDLEEEFTDLEDIDLVSFVLPDASNKLKDAIYNSVIEKKNKKNALREIEETFKKLGYTKSQLGQAYESIYTSLQTKGKLHSSLSDINRYKKIIDGTPSADQSVQMSTDPYNKYNSEVFDVTSRSENYTVNIKNLITGNKISDRLNKKFIFIKIPETKKSGFIHVNNAFLLEI